MNDNESVESTALYRDLYEQIQKLQERIRILEQKSVSNVESSPVFQHRKLNRQDYLDILYSYKSWSPQDVEKYYTIITTYFKDDLILTRNIYDIIYQSGLSSYAYSLMKIVDYPEYQKSIEKLIQIFLNPKNNFSDDAVSRIKTILQ